MKYKKLITRTFGQKSDNSKLLGFGLLAGLAAGAVLAVLFTPKSGRDLRKTISEDLMKFGKDRNSIYALLISKIKRNSNANSGIEKKAETKEREHSTQHANHGVSKKPKSDIKGLVQELHGAHTEQGL